MGEHHVLIRCIPPKGGVAIIGVVSLSGLRVIVVVVHVVVVAVASLCFLNVSALPVPMSSQVFVVCVFGVFFRLGFRRVSGAVLFVCFVVYGIALGLTFGVIWGEVATFRGKGGTLVFDRPYSVFAL